MQDPTNQETKGMAFYILTRGLLALVLVVVVLWAMTFFIGKLNRSGALPSEMESSVAVEAPAQGGETLVAQTVPDASSHLGDVTSLSAPGETPDSGAVDPHNAPAARPALPAAPQPEAAPRPAPVETPQPHAAPQPEAAQGTAATGTAGLRPTGVVFVEAVIKPLEHELEDRFWGWRPNDIINVTDNVNNFQLGVLEVTRRTAVQMVERISRTGSTDAIDRNLENAMNWLMIKATTYWFPTPESKYKESIRELGRYKDKLLNGTAYFYVRTDNLIPLLAVYEDLLGSCDENLVKHMERDGSEVSYFSADDYFYYAKGVASTMATILEAVQTDFAKTLENRRASELLHHAIESCRRAADVEPWIVTNADLDGILANHRANIAAPISHAAFYLGQLIRTLST